MSEQPKERKRGGERLTSEPRKKQTPRQKKREKLIMTVMIVLTVIMVLAATVAVFYARWVKKPTLPSTSESASPGVSQSADPDASDVGADEAVSAEPEYDPVQPKVSGERRSEDFYTILVFGTDESSNLTDTMMVVSYDVTNQKATAMSLPRDTLINARVSGVDTKKLNTVYSRNGGGEKGINALMDETSELVGFAIDYYVVINWELVGLMVDAIGGVWFDIPNDMKYKDPYQDLYIDLDEGYQLLDGDMAMQLVRWRHNNDGSGIAANGDIGRLDIQHDFLKAVLKQTLQLKNATKVSELAKLFGEQVVSNLTIENLFWFATQAIFNGLNVDNVQFVTMPFYYGEYPVKSGNEWKMRSFVYPARKDLLTLINESLNPFVDEVTLKELDLVYLNSEGGLSSTSGSLADPSMAALPEEYLIWKNGPETTEEPGETDAPDSPTGPGTGEGAGDDPGPETSDDPNGVPTEPIESGGLGWEEDPTRGDTGVVPTDPNGDEREPVETGGSDVPTE